MIPLTSVYLRVPQIDPRTPSGYRQHHPDANLLACHVLSLRGETAEDRSSRTKRAVQLPATLRWLGLRRPGAGSAGARVLRTAD